MATRRGNGEGGKPVKRKDGRWHIKVRTDATTTGVAVRKDFYGKTRAEVTEKYRVWRRAVDNGALVAPSRLTFEGWCKEWLETIKAPALQPQTLVSYRRYLAKWLYGTREGRLGLDKVSPLDIDRVLGRIRAAGRTENTALHVYRILGKALKDAYMRGLVGSIATDRVQPPRVAPFEAGLLKPEEIRRLTTYALEDENHGAHILTMLIIGARAGERLGLCWDAVDFEAGTIELKRVLVWLPWAHGCGGACGASSGYRCPSKVGGGPVIQERTKSAAGRRTWAVPEPVLEALRALKERQSVWRAQEDWQGFTDAAGREWDLVFCQTSGRPLSHQQDARIWKGALKACELPELRPHDARHTAATALLSLGVAPRVVMDLMGWSDVGMLSRYQHVLDDMRLDAAERLGGAFFA